MRSGLARFIHPMVLIEYHQSKRHLLIALAVLALIAVALRLWMGVFGVVVGIFIVIPNVGVGLGVGTFHEEISKGQLRYLYGMPMRWSTVWWIKQASAVLCLLLVAAMVSSIILVGNNDWLAPFAQAFPDQTQASVNWEFITGSLIYSFLSYGLGIFTISVCRSAKLANLIAAGLIYLPLAVLAFICLRFGLVPDIYAVAAMFASGLTVLLVGSFVLFCRRNPLVDTPWRQRGIAAIFIVLAGLFFVGAGFAADFMGAQFRQLHRQANSFYPSPDGQSLALDISDGVLSYGLVIDLNGKVLTDLGRGIAPVRDVGLAWRPGTDQVLCEPRSLWDQLRPLGAFSPAYERRVLIDSVTGEHSPVRVDLENEFGRVLYLSHWSADGRSLIGRDRVPGPEGEGYGSYINQAVVFDVDQARGRRISLRESVVDASAEVGAGGVVLLKYDTYGGDDEPWAEVVDLDDDSRKRVTLPLDTETWELSPGYNKALAVVKVIDDQGVGYRVLLFGFEGEEPMTVLDKDQLPRISTQEALRSRGGYNPVGAYFLGDGRWLLVTITGEDSEARVEHLLFDSETGERLDVDLGFMETYGQQPILSPDHQTWLYVNSFGGSYYGYGDDDPDEPVTTTIVAHAPFQSGATEPFEQTFPGYINGIHFLDNDTVVFVLMTPTDRGVGFTAPQKSNLLRMDIPSGELYRLYPDPGSVEPDDLEPDLLAGVRTR